MSDRVDFHATFYICNTFYKSSIGAFLKTQRHKLFIWHMIRWHILRSILKLWAQNLSDSDAHRVDKITPAPPPLTLSPSFSVTTQRIQSKVETGAPLRSPLTIIYPRAISRCCLPYHNAINDGRLDFCYCIAHDSYGWIQGRSPSLKASSF